MIDQIEILDLYDFLKCDEDEHEDDENDDHDLEYLMQTVHEISHKRKM
jgi:hypothetical protein